MTDHFKPAMGGVQGAVRLGLFDLIEPVGFGGMGEVWRGAHVEQGVPVAIKVITRRAGWQRSQLASFRDEVRAMAGLDHRGVALVFDEGQVDGDVERASEGRLTAGSPYLVMEYAGLGTLEGLEGRPLPWSVCRGIGLGLLEALGHAHARGVIHRDIKPANVLLAGPQDIRPGLKLTDFGIAHILESEETERSGLTIGTPQFMAPEQFEGRWRDYGPWTDLYAFGVMMWLLLSGRLPFDGFNPLMLAHKHLTEPLPALELRAGLAPPGVEAWLARLLAKAPQDRFERAADAARALRGLGEVEVEVNLDPAEVVAELLAAGEPGEQVRTRLFGATEPETVSHLESATTAPPAMFPVKQSVEGSPGGLAGVGSSGAGQRGSCDPPPAPPKSWRQARAEEPSPQLQGVGVGLFELRHVPLVGRERERDALWGALRATCGQGQAHAVVLRGAAGVGKSRLAEWLCERAHALGVATILTARHSLIPGPGAGLRGMLARHLRCVGAGPEEVARRCTAALDALGIEGEHARRALAQLVHPVADEGEGGGFETPAARYGFLRRVLERLSRRRPLIVWLDDVQWGADALGLVGHLLKQREGSPHPILLVLTARDEALVEAPVARWALREVVSMPGASRVDLAPLSRRQSRQLVRRLLDIEGSLADALARRCGGNALFAVQLVGDWIHRKALRPGAEGFVLAFDESAALPDSLHVAWRDRVARLLEGRPAQEREALEIAAALGDEVDEVEWAAACGRAGIEVPEGLVDVLLDKRLALSDEGGWRFVHGMLRESLERTALERGRSRRHHAACAATRAELHAPGAPGVSERRGRHLLASGACEQAAEQLMEAVHEHTRRNEFKLARALLEVYEEALEGAGIPRVDPRWGQCWVIRARILGYQVKLEEARALLLRVLEHCEALGWVGLRPGALRGLADIERMQCDLPRAAAHYEEALAGFEAAGDEGGMAACLMGMGSTAQQRGDLEGATSLIERAMGLWERLDQEVNVAHGFIQLGHIAQSRGALDQWEALIHEALALTQSRADPFSLAKIHNELAEVARARGDLEAAESGYRRSAALCVAAGFSEDVAQINLALVLLARCRFAEARSQVLSILPGMTQSGRSGFLAYAHAALLAAAPDAAPAAWAEHFGDLKRLLAETEVVDTDLAWCAQLAAERALAYDLIPHARDAAELALAQWRALDEAEKADEAAALLRSLPALHPLSP